MCWFIIAVWVWVWGCHMRRAEVLTPKAHCTEKGILTPDWANLVTHCSFVCLAVNKAGHTRSLWRAAMLGSFLHAVSVEEISFITAHVWLFKEVATPQNEKFLFVNVCFVWLHIRLWNRNKVGLKSIVEDKSQDDSEAIWEARGSKICENNTLGCLHLNKGMIATVS